MKSKILLTLFIALLGVVASKATTVNITVDKAVNVTVQGNNGYGDLYTLQDGANAFEIDPSAQNPLLITPTEGAEIVKIIANGNEAFASGDGTYRIGIGGPSFDIDITTSGNGSSSTPVAKSSNFNIYVSGDGVTGAPYTLYVKKNGEWTEPEAGDFGMKYKVEENAEMKITPVAPYEIESVTIQNQSAPLEVTREDDGSIVFLNTIPDYYNLMLNMKLSDSAIRFSVQVDYPRNIVAYLEWQRNGSHDWEVLTLNSGVNTFAILDDANPLEFMAVAGGEILQVTCNGEVVNPIGWEGTGGYLISVANGDAFTVTTRGPEIEMLVSAASSSTADLSAYYFTKSDGTELQLSGRQTTITGNQGEYVYVSPRPGTTYDMVLGSNGAETDRNTWKDWFRITPGLDGVNPASVELYGSRDVNGVVLDIDNADRISIVQEGGRGDALALTSGKNSFDPSSIKNALAISATEGNQILSVTLDGNPVAVNAQGVYLVSVAEGNYVQVKSRKSPVETAISFEFNEGADMSRIKLMVDGTEVPSISPLNVKTYSTITLSAAAGYVIDNLSCDEPSLLISNAEGVYTIEVSSADINAATIALSISEIAPAEGNAIVIPNGDPMFIRYTEVYFDTETNSYSRVKVLENNTVNEVKIGNFIQIYRIDGQTEYRYVTVNGETLDNISSRALYVEIEGRTTIEAEVYSPTYTYSTESYDDQKFIVSGKLEFEVNGTRTSYFYAEPGMTVKIVPIPSTGYVFDHAELFYPTTMASEGFAIEGDTYTFTEEDCQNEFLLFKGVFNVDQEEKVYVLRGSTAWIVDENGNLSETSSSAAGNVVFSMGDGTYSREYTGIAGEVVKLEISVTDPEIFALYQVAGFCLMDGFPNSLVSDPYTINPDDANADGIIWICGLMTAKSDAIDGVAAGEGLRYDAAVGKIFSEGGVKVFNVNGSLLIDSTADETSVDSLAKGLYIAVSGSKTIKFVK